VPHLILSDIHGNIEALNAVVEDARGLYSTIACLGDLVGYGADPNAVVEWIRANCAAVIRGNHDRACVSNEAVDNYNPAARASVLWTRNSLTEESKAYLRELPRGPKFFEEADLVHGSPVDEDDYVVTPDDANQVRPVVARRVTFFGHTHIQGGFQLTRFGSKRIPRNRVLEIAPDDHYLVNPGSVGQPRDRDPGAAYALYDPSSGTVEFRRVAYDVDAAAHKILNAGLPDFLAVRLFEGI
jgi:diadenosine tetraphosphatase ApaH/serine/threonine PP2A family protein phosphatase